MMNIKIKLSIYRYHKLLFIPNSYKFCLRLKENKHTFATTYAQNS